MEWRSAKADCYESRVNILRHEPDGHGTFLFRHIDVPNLAKTKSNVFLVLTEFAKLYYDGKVAFQFV